MADPALVKQLLDILDELEARFKEGTMVLKEMIAYVESKGISHLDGYLRRCGALDYQSPKRFYQQGVDLEAVRKALKDILADSDSPVPRGLEGLLLG